MRGENERLEEQARAWNRFAREDPEFYIGHRWVGEEFYKHAQSLAEEAVNWANLPRRGCAIDLGSGIGRMTVVLARHFDRVAGLDISAEMIRRARARHPAGIQWEVIRDGRLPVDDSSVDFVYSYNVFQHIRDRSVVQAYLHETCRVLNPDGRSVFQFDTRRQPPWRVVAYWLPDPLLPRAQRRFIRRHPIPPGELYEQIRGAHLRVLDERGVSTDDHHVLLARE
jgi:ubiquinone/menaquinone biosynthesis C-methylase UbiE